MVVAPSTGRIPASSYLEPVMSLEIAPIMGYYFENTMWESMSLQEWVSISEYFKEVATTNMPVELDTFTRLMQLDDKSTPYNRRKMDPGLPPDK